MGSDGNRQHREYGHDMDPGMNSVMDPVLIVVFIGFHDPDPDCLNLKKERVL